MGYRIDYGPAPKTRPAGFRSLLRLQLLTAVFLLLFVLGVKKAWPEGTKKLQQLLLPGSSSASMDAFHGFLDDLREGDSFHDAFAAFCREVVDRADIEN